jgi:hypothetical protein
MAAATASPSTGYAQRDRCQPDMAASRGVRGLCTVDDTFHHTAHERKGRNLNGKRPPAPASPQRFRFPTGVNTDVRVKESLSSLRHGCHTHLRIIPNRPGAKFRPASVRSTSAEGVPFSGQIRQQFVVRAALNLSRVNLCGYRRGTSCSLCHGSDPALPPQPGDAVLTPRSGEERSANSRWRRWALVPVPTGEQPAKCPELGGGISWQDGHCRYWK